MLVSVLLEQLTAMLLGLPHETPAGVLAAQLGPQQQSPCRPQPQNLSCLSFLCCSSPLHKHKGRPAL